MVKCNICGHPIAIGEWPFCGGDPSKHTHVDRFGEDPMEPYFDENLVREPGGVEITTRAQRRKLMYDSNMEYRPKAKLPGQTLFFDLGGK